MKGYEIYVFILCLIVFVLLAGLSAILLATIAKQAIRLIRHGAEDEDIKTEYEKAQKKKRKSCLGTVLDAIITVTVSIVILGFFGFSTYVNIRGDQFYTDVPTIKVVNSGSMSKKYEKNKYLFENNLNDQIQTFDLVFTYKVPDEEDLALYDIVLYEVDGMMVMHRIVGIEEPSEKHPEERWFLLQGDNVETPDRFPVRYEQIRAIYRGERIPYIGSFVTFMQSPAGWLCVFLIVVALVATPLIERLLEKERQKRLALLLGVAEETKAPAIAAEIFEETSVLEESVAESTEKTAATGFSGKRDMRPFAQKLAEAAEELQSRYYDVEEFISRISGVKGRDSRKFRTFKVGRLGVIRFAIKGKTLNAYLNLDPADYAESKYVFIDETQVKSSEGFAMRLKVTSDRQARWVKELLEAFCTKNGIALHEPAPIELESDLPVENAEITENAEIVEETVPVETAAEPAYIEWNEALATDDRFSGKRDMRTFAEKLFDADEELQLWYAGLAEYLRRIEGVKERDSRKYRTYKCGRLCLTRFAIKGKTLNMYLNLDPKAYDDTKYVFTDVSDSKSSEDYPMRKKITSERQVRWAKELIDELCKKYGLTMNEPLEMPETAAESEAAYTALDASGIDEPFYMRLRANRDERSFAERLAAASEVVQARYAEIVKALASIKGVRKLAGKKHETWLRGSVPVARIALRGKTLNVYLGLDPVAFADTKYVYTDVSAVRKYGNYPMRVKLTSERQTRWTKELIQKLAQINGLTVLEGEDEN